MSDPLKEVLAAVCVAELSGLVQRIYWADFFPTLGAVYNYGLVAYAQLCKKSVAPFMVFLGGGTPSY